MPRSLHSTQTLCGGMLGLRPLRKAREHLQQLLLVDRAAMQLEVDIDVRLDRRGGGERVDEVGPCIDRLGELVHVLEVAQRLDAAGGRAGPDGDQRA